MMLNHDPSNARWGHKQASARMQLSLNGNVIERCLQATDCQLVERVKKKKCKIEIN